MNPADPGWRAFAAARLREIQTSWGYDGIWLDNLDLDRDRALQGVTNSDGGLREYATTAAWQTAVAGWLAQVREALGPTPLWANLVGGDLAQRGWDAYAPYLDGAMEESFAVTWLQGWRTDEEWRADESRAEAWLAQGKGLVLVGQGPQEDLERMRFTLASYMLVAQGDRTSFRYTRYDSYYMGWWWYPDYAQALALGPPIGIRHEVEPGVWQREFAHGLVEVNLTTHTGRMMPAADGGGS